MGESHIFSGITGSSSWSPNNFVVAFLLEYVCVSIYFPRLFFAQEAHKWSKALFLSAAAKSHHNIKGGVLGCLENPLIMGCFLLLFFPARKE